MTTTTDLSLPSALTSLRRKLAIGWTSHVTGPTAGELVGGGLSEDTDGAGKRRRITKHVPVTSYALKACHAATGRAFVAVWAHRHGDLTKAGKPRWSLEIAARGRHEGEHTPQHMTSQQLAAYAASRTVEEYLAALDELATRRRPKKEVRTSVETEKEAA